MPSWLLLGLLSVGAWFLFFLLRLPRHVALESATESVPAPLLAVVEAYEACGFRALREPLLVRAQVLTLLVPLHHEEEGLYATVFLPRARGRRLGYDVVSFLADEAAFLTTAMDPLVGASPGWAGSFRQILPGAAPAEMVEGHRAALAHLARLGFEACDPGPERFEALFSTAFRREREAFMRAPLRHTLVGVWRSASGQSPFRGPLADQPTLDAQVAAAREVLEGREPVAV